ncbi:hypothetical protein B7486_56935 [cyanobacterium TDX16]|nr:hypothetical protein B7486_56935 [cyanobacterium TDX16]
MRDSHPHKHRTIVVQLKFSDAARAVEAALPIVEALMQEIESIQQLQRISEFKLMAEIHLTLSFRGFDEATALVTQAIDNSAYQLEELRSERQITDFAVEYEILHSKHSRRQHSDDF